MDALAKMQILTILIGFKLVWFDLIIGKSLRKISLIESI